MAETHEFQAEVAQVLHLVIHSLYRNREIFLRELISNASDALDKRRFRALSEPAIGADDLEVRLLPDAEAGTLTLWDNGIGMTRDELVENLGTVAKSGTRAFLEQLEKAQGDVQLIGQFGVGFYSAFLVADQVVVTSRAAGSDEAWSWTSDGRSSFTVEAAEREEAGTTITLHLSEDYRGDFTREYGLRNLVRQYSDYVSWPIKLSVTRQEGEGDERTDVQSLEEINQGEALWRLKPEDIESDQYAEFYKHLTHSWDEPLAQAHFSVEGTQMFTSLLFVPKTAPMDLFDSNAKRGVRLYVNRVFIMEDAEELVPVWLRFLRGVVDSNDLPLNVSRDVLQDSRAARVIKKQIVKKTLDLFEEMQRERPDDWAQVWDQFGRVLKEGVHFEAKHKERIAKLARFHTTAEGAYTTLEEYVERMPEGQEDIYFAIGTSETQLARSPQLEGLKKKGYEVLLMTDAVDQWFVESLAVFDERKLVSAMHADIDFDDDKDAEGEDGEDKPKSPGLGAFGDAMGEALGERVAEVRASNRLSDSPVCLVIPQGGLPSHIERMLRAQQEGLPPIKRILEVNPAHPLIETIQAKHDAEGPDAVRDHIELLYDQALVLEGTPLDDPASFAQRMTALMLEASRK